MVIIKFNIKLTYFINACLIMVMFVDNLDK